MFRDYTKSHSITYADLMVRFLLKEAPKRKSFQIQVCKLEGWLDDSEAHGQVLLERYRACCGYTSGCRRWRRLTLKTSSPNAC